MFKFKDVDWSKLFPRKSPVEKLVEEAEAITEKARSKRKHHDPKTLVRKK